jgi:hypothetical protein
MATLGRSDPELPTAERLGEFFEFRGQDHPANLLNTLPPVPTTVDRRAELDAPFAPQLSFCGR